MLTGTWGEYVWLTMPWSPGLRTVLRVVPGIGMDGHVAVRTETGEVMWALPENGGKRLSEVYVFRERCPESMAPLLPGAPFDLNSPDQADPFWRQLEALGVETYLSEQTVLTFASRNKELFHRVEDLLCSVG